MNKWIINCDSYLEQDELNSKLINKVKEAKCNNKDLLFTYTLNHEVTGILLLSTYEILKNEENYTLQEKKIINQEIDLPYSIFYKTEQLFNITSLSNNEVDFILQNTDNKSEKDIKELFADYINNDWSIETKKVEKRIEYLDKILPERLDSKNPTSIFEIFDENILQDIVQTLKKGNINYDWDRRKGGGGEIQQTLNQYIKFLEKIKDEGFDEPSGQQEKDNNKEINVFESFIKRIEHNDEVKVDEKWKNIEFIIGQPNTGKSYNFEESRLFDTKYKEYYKYKKIPVSGGIGNEYKGLQNTDLALTFDPTKNEIRFGEFLQILMSAITNPKVPHVVFLDDFHNQDISSLMSEYTPLFKSQQMRDILKVDTEHPIYAKKSYSGSDEFITVWNDFIENNCSEIPKVPLTNRISGESLKLVFPSNFYLFGAANFNENTLNIFADWEDRANITYKDPIETFTLKNDESGFVECCKALNNNLRITLEENNVFDYEKYCFGMWKIVDSDGNAITDDQKQTEVFRFLFGMIRNALRFNNKNSEINNMGWNLIIKLYSQNKWFKTFMEKELKIKELNSSTDDITYKYQILHKLNIYEDDI